MAKTLLSQCRGPMFNPGQGTRSHMPQVRPSAEQITIAGKDVKKWEPSYTVDGNVNWSSYYRKQYRGSSKKKINNLITI